MVFVDDASVPLDIPPPMTPTTLVDDTASDTRVGVSTEQARAGESAALDLVDAIRGMYRILDLVSEPGSDGLGAFSSLVRISTRAQCC